MRSRSGGTRRGGHGPATGGGGGPGSSAATAVACTVTSGTPNGSRTGSSVDQGADGLAWHNHYRLDRTLETVRWEAATVSRVLGTRATALLCVHGAHVYGGGVHVQGVAIVPAHLLRSALGYDRVLSDRDVELLVATARMRLRPAA